MAKFFFYDFDILHLLSKDQRTLSGGAAVQSYVWIQGLTSLDHKVYIPTYSDDKQVVNNVKNVEIIPIYNKNRGVKKIRIVYYRLPSLFLALKRIKPDYVYQSIPSWMSFFMAIFCRILKIKFVVRIANDNDLDRGYIKYYSNFIHGLLSLGIKFSHCVLTQNSFQYNQLRKRFPNKTALKIHNPFLFKEIEQNESTSPRYIAWVAKIRYVKNLKLLYEIATIMKEERFEIAGIRAEGDPETDEYMEKLKLLKNVTFRGLIKREEILPFLSEAKYLLNTSRYEGFSNTYLEAMSVGTPILTTPKANPDHIIDKNRIGIIYQDSLDLREKIGNLSEESYRDMAKRCVEYVKKNHDYVHLTKELLRFLEKIK